MPNLRQQTRHQLPWADLTKQGYNLVPKNLQVEFKVLLSVFISVLFV
jgi:hypothetical protein